MPATGSTPLTGATQAVFLPDRGARNILIYITEVAKKFGDAWIENDVREANLSSNPKLLRLTFKRMSYAANAEGKFDPEYAEVYGVPVLVHPLLGLVTQPQGWSAPDPRAGP